MVPLLTGLSQQQETHRIPMERFYELAGISRQAYFKAKNKQFAQQQMMAEITRSVINYRSEIDSRAGSRSLFYNLGIKQKFQIGVNKFERLMQAYNLTLAPVRVRVVTTRSCTQSWNYPNLTNGLVVNGINELVVGDLTWISYGYGQYYLFCLTDVYSARIVGHCLSKRMRAKEALVALKKWIALRGSQNLANCIHHTDGGTQYFSRLYLQRLKDHQLQISVARNCLENGFAEQRNGFIKHHLLPILPNDLNERQLEKRIAHLIARYNQERKQEKLGWKSPGEVEKWCLTLRNPPELILFDRDKKIRSERKGFRRHKATEIIS